ncbi:MAG: 50S ribosomal protein L6 [Elusimicrobiota bacterium]|jgi:large subunit ribosomal protein L6|nr:50S ribosomal protein L6 [Elusimicrobiota bacterium]
MSRLGKNPVQLPEGVKAEFSSGVLKVFGSVGSISRIINEKMIIEITDSSISVKPISSTRQCNMLHGLTRGLIVNMVEGVSNGFKKELKMVGLGYKSAIKSNNELELSVGFSHLVSLGIPSCVKLSVAVDTDKNTIISIFGVDKSEVGAFAAKIRDIKRPEPYKGFGIRYTKSEISADGRTFVYTDEKIIRKSGKAAAASGGKK